MKYQGVNRHENKEELNALKEEVETLNKKLQELTIEELEQVTGSGRRRVEFVLTCPLCGHEFNRTTARAWVVCKYTCLNCNVSVTARIREVEIPT